MSVAMVRQDLMVALKRHDALLYFGWDDVRQQYKRTLLGPIWLTFSTCAWIFAMALVMASLFNQNISDFLPRTATGMFVWTFFSLSILDGATVFVGAAPLINATRLPLFFYPLRALIRYVILYGHYLAVCLLLMICIGHPPGWMAFLAIPGLLIHVATSFGFILLFGLSNARYRDIFPIAGVLCQLMPLMTPIAWQREMLKKHTWIADMNPFYHLIEIVRAPLMGHTPAALSYIVSLGTMVVVLTLGLIIYKRVRYKLIFWI
ncbi:MAG: ABC transporter permease [Pseudomonadota bacterium]